MATKPLVLPPKLAQLHNILTGEGEMSIEDIYRAFLNPDGKPLREAQQYLGPYISKLNRRLREHNQAVKPGRLKGTYALVTL